MLPYSIQLSARLILIAVRLLAAESEEFYLLQSRAAGADPVYCLSRLQISSAMSA